MFATNNSNWWDSMGFENLRINYQTKQSIFLYNCLSFAYINYDSHLGRFSIHPHLPLIKVKCLMTKSV